MNVLADLTVIFLGIIVSAVALINIVKVLALAHRYLFRLHSLCKSNKQFVFVFVTFIGFAAATLSSATII